VILAAVLLLLAGLAARMLLGARLEVQRARAAADKRDTEARLRHLRRAMAYYLPGNPWVREAHDRLLLAARDARARGDHAAALDAYRELRSAILRLRGSTRPYAETLPEVNRSIAALTSARAGAAPPARGTADAPPARGTADAPPARGTADAPPARGTADAPPARGTADAPPARGTADAPPARGTAAEQRLLRRLERPPEPHPGWACLGLLGFLLWVGGAFWLLGRGLRPDASAVGRRFWPLLGLVALGLCLFCVGMGLA
jgi:hypothetical protein